ncbi:MAG: M28 family peptidase [Lentisphaeria bacterium]|nr:M28 family peptidase [Lentisphaeria bacterium]
MNKNPFESLDREILGESGISGDVEKNLFSLCDDIGPRFAGTEGYREAAEFMLEKFKRYGFDQAELEPFEFTAWRRGEAATFSLWLPEKKAFPCYELPYSASTGPEGIARGLVDIGAGAKEDLKSVGDGLKGCLALVTKPGGHRMDIYARCVKQGAAGFIWGNTVPGMMLASGSVTEAEPGKIPAISIPLESVYQIQRVLKNGAEACQFHVQTDSRVETGTTWNVVAELPGNAFPDEWVIIGGHLDSHEIGPGAYDNGAGAVMVLETARLLIRIREHLQRSVRFILFAGEEVGLIGSHYHAKAHADDMKKARFMLNCDMPSLGRPRGIAFHECPKGADYLKSLETQMETEIVCQNRGHCHSDHYPFILQGVPTAGVGGGPLGPKIQSFYHMAADTPEKISITDLRDCAAFAARFLLRTANDECWPDMRRTKEEINTFGSGK